MRYAGLMVAVLESRLRDSFFGLADQPVCTDGDFALHVVGPFGAAFNFGDRAPIDVSPLACLSPTAGLSTVGSRSVRMTGGSCH
jgi:hypothetical protein